jgi:hypothetical protein
MTVHIKLTTTEHALLGMLARYGEQSGMTCSSRPTPALRARARAAAKAAGPSRAKQ